jgi:cellulose synthase/poly-beta-1,6-N-acetylglucosamine synthase-like glycosyltransferase
MKAFPSISVIIPSNHALDDLLKIVTALCNQAVKPTEIIIIDSFTGGGICPDDISNLCSIHSIRLIYEHRKLSFPGQARNVGVGLAKSEFVAFIDVQTIPRKSWLKSTLEVLIKENVAGIFGSTSFEAETWFERLVRDAFFGVLPRKTLPGSIFKREVFDATGHFISWVRAGEDTEWMLRLELMKIPMASMSIELVDYEGLKGISLNSILRKWHRNYSASHKLPHLFPQKIFLWIILYPLIIFVGFNWNYLIANWRMDSPFYIGHITKIAAILPPLAYVFTRGVLLPLKRGVRISGLFPIRFILIAAVCFMADGVKAFVFTKPRWIRE